ncbi:MAG: GGDEF domain-containing phosphodiesterase, partial [Natronospirillum sp.]
ENDQVLAHWAGDKFAVYDPSGSAEQIDRLVQRLQRSLSLPLSINSLCLRALTAGFGIAFQEQDSSAHDLPRNADTALSRAKQTGSSGRCVFEQSMQNKASSRLSILNDLSHAISHGELLNYYQPIHHAASGEIVGLETLVRWQHPDKGMIPPDQFIPMAEHAGLIAQLGEVVLEQCLRDFQSWRRQGLTEPALFMNINISPLQLLEPGFADLLSSALTRFEIPAELMVLEITETAMMQSETVSLKILQELRGRGFRIAIDDFGSGYSSLNYLHKLPVQILKIDRALVEQMANSHQVPLVKPIVEIARALGMRVIAEGVETAEQAAQLAQLDVDYLQGYHLSRPAPPEALQSLLLAPQDVPTMKIMS